MTETDSEFTKNAHEYLRAILIIAFDWPWQIPKKRRISIDKEILIAITEYTTRSNDRTVN